MKKPPQVIGQFIQECEPLLRENWPFFSSDQGVLEPVLALHIKCLKSAPDDADTIFFWNVAKEAQKKNTMGTTDLAVLSAGATLFDLKIAEKLLGRFHPGARYHAHMTVCAGKHVTLPEQRFWCRDFEGTENNFVRWLLARAYENTPQRCEIVATCIKIWQNEISEEYPGKMGGCFEEGFGIHHPFTKWTQGVE